MLLNIPKQHLASDPTYPREQQHEGRPRAAPSGPASETLYKAPAYLYYSKEAKDQAYITTVALYKRIGGP